MKKSIKLLEEKRDEIISTLKKLPKYETWDSVLSMTKKLQDVNDAISYLTRNYLQ